VTTNDRFHAALGNTRLNAAKGTMHCGLDRVDELLAADRRRDGVGLSTKATACRLDARIDAGAPVGRRRNVVGVDPDRLLVPVERRDNSVGHEPPVLARVATNASCWSTSAGEAQGVR
jgi:hypothetical protein